MPHIIIEYSKNLEPELDIDEFIGAVHHCATGIDALPLAGIRTRSVRRDHYRVADGHRDNAFVNVTLRLAAGRSHEVRKAAGELLFESMSSHLAAIMQRRPVALSFEIIEIDPEMRWKRGNIRDYLARRAN